MSGLPFNGVIRRRPWYGCAPSTPSQRLASESLELPVVQFVLRDPRRVARSRSSAPARSKYSPDSESDPFVDRKNGLGGSSPVAVHEFCSGEVEGPNESWDDSNGASTVAERSSSNLAHSIEQKRPELCVGGGGGRDAVLIFGGERGFADEGVGVVGVDSVVGPSPATTSPATGAWSGTCPAEVALLIVPEPDLCTPSGLWGSPAETVVAVVVEGGLACGIVQIDTARRRQIEDRRGQRGEGKGQREKNDRDSVSYCCF